MNKYGIISELKCIVYFMTEKCVKLQKFSLRRLPYGNSQRFLQRTFMISFWSRRFSKNRVYYSSYALRCVTAFFGGGVFLHLFCKNCFYIWIQNEQSPNSNAQSIKRGMGDSRVRFTGKNKWFYESSESFRLMNLGLWYKRISQFLTVVMKILSYDVYQSS